MFVRCFGTFVGLASAAYVWAVASGMTIGPAICRTNCQMNASLRQLIGDDAANLLLGGSWMAAGVVFIAFINLRRGAKQSKATCRKQGTSRL